MKKRLIWAVALILTGSAILTSCSSDDIVVNDNPQAIDSVDSVETDKAAPLTFSNMKEVLEHIKEVEKITEIQDTNYKESYKIFFRQPIDHQNPSAGTFLQQVIVKFKDFNAATVFYTCGYEIAMSTDDMANFVGGNTIIVEHRYYGESLVKSDPEYKYLTIKQEADDLHAIATAMKVALKGKWISTGLSKNGCTAIEYRYYHPEDVDGTVAFCAPILTSLSDPRPMSYMLRECGTPEVNAMMNKMIVKLLTGGEQGFYKKYLEYIGDEEEVTFTQYCSGVFNLYFNTFMCGSPDNWSTILPDTTTPDNKLCEKIDEAVLISPTEENIDDVRIYSYYIQQAKELGTEGIVTDETRDLLKGTSCTAESYSEMHLMPKDRWLIKTYDNTVEKKILDEFLPTTTSKMLLVYSKNDPWTGAAPKGLNNPNVQVLISPVGCHEESLSKSNNLYHEPTVNAIKAFIDGL